MNEKLTNDINKICNMMASVNKMDVRFIDRQGNSQVQVLKHNIPALFQDLNTINDTLMKNATNSYYYFINAYSLHYIATGIWRNNEYNGAIIVGPFLSSVPGEDFISDIISKNSIPVSERRKIQELYQSLSVINNSTSTSIGELLVNLSSNPLIDSKIVTVNNVTPSNNNKTTLKTVIEENKIVIENRYRQQEKLINAIMQGDRKKIDELRISVSDYYLENRIPESPLRSSKNLMLVLNTICRFAAQQGGVHPVYIHEISEKFAILIERAPNFPYLNNLIGVMLYEYCDLVKEFTTSKYSHLIKEAIDFIHLNMGSPFSLQEIATSINTNPSHLSRKFKKETGISITEFINIKRVETAKLYLRNENITITDIAFMVGFNDINYFSRVFKKITSLTPSQYAKKTIIDN